MLLLENTDYLKWKKYPESSGEVPGCPRGNDSPARSGMIGRQTYVLHLSFYSPLCSMRKATPLESIAFILLTPDKKKSYRYICAILISG